MKNNNVENIKITTIEILKVLDGQTVADSNIILDCVKAELNNCGKIDRSLVEVSFKDIQ